MVISVLNEKGGVGKTSICYNVGYYMASLGKKVLFIDLDGQKANLSFFAGIKNKEDFASMGHILIDGADIKKSIQPVKQNIDLIVGNSKLTEIDKSVSIQSMLDVIKTVEKDYDIIFIDVNPTPSRIHVLAMAASNYIIVPMLPDVATLEANKGIIETYNIVKTNVNPELKILGVVFNKYDSRTKLSQQVMEVTESMCKQLNTNIFNTKIRNNIALAENVGSHVGVTDYNAKSNGAIDIVQLTSEIFARI